MRILHLSVDHVKRVEAVDITPDPAEPVVVISGANAQGKSSVLDAIFYALAGTRGIPEDAVINENSETGAVTIDLDNGLRVTRAFARGATSRLIVRDLDPNGAVRRSPQHLLNSFIGDLSFDPLEFDRAKPKDRVSILVKALGIADAIEDIEAERREAYEQRTAVNRLAKEYKAKLSGLMPHRDAPKEPVSITEMYEELRQYEAENAANVALRAKARRIAEAIADTQAQIERLQETLTEQLKSNEEIAKQVDGLVDTDLTDVRRAIENAEKDNEKAVANRRFLELSADLAAKEKESSELTDLLAELEERKLKTVAAVAFPIEEVAFTEEGVTLHGLPWEVASTAERIRTSVAIGMSLNPSLRIMLIREGSFLDDDSLREVAKLATESEFQVWIETVREGAIPSIIIEDGRVANVAEEEVRT
jgi:DNA repair exonuclease SbcCD ATPase subunit